MLKKILLCTGVSGGMILTAEATLRWFPAYNPMPFFVEVPPGPTRPDSLFIPDPVIGWRLRPGVRDGKPGTRVTVNSAGFRGPNEVNPAEAPIVVVGDSFSQGSGVGDTDTYAAQLERLLGGPRVANFAIPGFSIDQIALTVRHYALPLTPRLIVVGVVDLDFERTFVTGGKRFARPSMKLVNKQVVPHAEETGAIVRWLDAHGRLWRAGRLALQRLGHSLPIGSWWTVNAAWLADMHEQAASRGVPVLFVYLPTSAGPPFPMLQKHFTTLGAHYLDLSQEPARPEWYIPIDGHPSVAGHRRIAERIHDWIQSHGDLLTMR